MELSQNEIIYTGVDSLLQLVNQKGRVDLSHASKALNVDKQTVEVWADTLEEMGDIISKYGFSERKLMSSDYFHKENNSISTFLWQINPMSKKVIIKKKENSEKEYIQTKIREFIELKAQIQREKAQLEREKAIFREKMESEHRAFRALKQMYNLKLVDRNDFQSE